MTPIFFFPFSQITPHTSRDTAGGYVVYVPRCGGDRSGAVLTLMFFLVENTEEANMTYNAYVPTVGTG